MSSDIKNQKEWVDAWKRASTKLKEHSYSGLRELKTTEALQDFVGLLEHSMKKLPLRKSSGLVAQQLLFRRLRSK